MAGQGGGVELILTVFWTTQLDTVAANVGVVPLHWVTR